MSSDNVNHPQHYNHISGIECIDVAENFNFNLGNSIKYIWRSAHKGRQIEDLRKAATYINREITRLEKNESKNKLNTEGSGQHVLLASKNARRGKGRATKASSIRVKSVGSSNKA